MTDQTKDLANPTRRAGLFRLSALVAGVATLTGGGVYAWKKASSRGEDEPEYIFGTVQKADIQDLVSATGSLQPMDYVDVGAQVSGQLKKIHVEVGSVVRSGDLLAEIDPEQYMARVDAIRAQLRNQQAQMQEREAQLAQAEQNFQRQKNLKSEDATTSDALLSAETALRVTRAQINALKAQSEQTSSSLRVEEANLKYAHIYAPMSGTVVSITARQGQTLNANQQAPNVLRLADLSSMTVQTQVSEADVSKLWTGMPAYFTTLGSRGRRWSGRLRKVEPTPTVLNNVVLYNALFDVSNANQDLMTQMTAQVFFIAASAEDALVVPMSAVTLARGEGRGRRSAEPQREASAPASSAASSASRAAGARDARRDDTEGLSRGNGASAIQAHADTPMAEGASRPRRRRDDADLPADAASDPMQRRERFRRDGADAAEPGASGGERRRRRREDADPSPVALQETTQNARPERIQARTPASEHRAAPTGQPPRRTPLEGRRRPAASVMRKGTVKVVGQDGKAVEREVTVGITNRVQAQILSGLKEGDRIVVGIKRQQDKSSSASNNAPLGMQGGMPGTPGGPGAGNFGGGRAPR